MSRPWRPTSSSPSDCSGGVFDWEPALRRLDELDARAEDPTLWDRPADAPDQTLEQVWFAGVHSDVGGGYPKPGLSEITLLWMVQRAARCGLAFDAGRFTKVAAPDEERRRLAEEVAPDPLGELHDSRTLIYRLQPPLDRELAHAGDPQVAIASTAVERYDELATYRPKRLAAWDRVHPPQATVVV